MTDNIRSFVEQAIKEKTEIIVLEKTNEIMDELDKLASDDNLKKLVKVEATAMIRAEIGQLLWRSLHEQLRKKKIIIDHYLSEKIDAMMVELEEKVKKI